MNDTDASLEISLNLLREGGVLRCRMLLSNLDRDRKLALDRIATRVEFWLAEWQSRDHSGTTAFVDL
jgi:hypothetical protein